MRELGVVALKWTVALLLLGGLVVYSIRGAVDGFASGVLVERESTPSPSPSAAPEGGEGPTAPQVPTGPVADGSAQATADVSVAGGLITGVSDEQLLIGPEAGAAAVLSFPLIPGAPQCVNQVRLEAELLEATAGQLGLYPSGLFDFSALLDGSTPPGSPVLDPSEPSVAVTNGSPGRLAWDVTNIYRGWALGAVFVQGRNAPVGSPFNVTIRPIVEAEEGREVVFSAVEAGGPVATITWTAVPGCTG